MRASLRIRLRSCATFALAALLLACSASPRLPRTVYPPAERTDIAEDFHGRRVADPYRGLETLDAAATRDWIARQNSLSTPFLEELPQRPWIRERLEKLITYERFGLPVKEGGRYFYLRNDGQQNQAALYVTADLSQAGRVLIDPNTLRGDATVALASIEPGPDARHVAYALSDGGTDWKSWHVRDVETGADLPDVIRHTKFTEVSWARDGSGFFYSSYPQGDDHRQPAIHFHRLGDPQEGDRLVYAVTDHPTRVPDGRVTEDGRYLVITLDEGTLSNGIAVLPLVPGTGIPAPDGAARMVLGFDGVHSFIGSRSSLTGTGGTELYFATKSGAPRGRVLAIAAGTPAAAPRVVVAEAAQVLTNAVLVGGRVLAVHLVDAHARAQLYEADGRPAGEVALPGIGDVVGISGDAGDAEAFFSYSDFFTPTRIYRLDVARAATSIWRAPVIAATTDGYETEQVFFASKDGTRVPMFLVHRRGLQRDGRQPVLMYGYGGFDISITPAFSPAVITWLEMGGVYAVVNLRGGGEYGEPWHRAGARANKQNVFDDFIAAAEYLVAQKWTRPSRLAIHGRSNGGLLVGAVLTQRPDLFGAALPEVGVLDMLRYHLASANARLWADDYGLAEDAADFRAQIAYSPYHNVHEGCYPPTLVTTAERDDRVVPWHSFKFAAALQAAQRCDKPVLLRVETRAGHGAGKPLWMQIENQADQFAFVAAALGMQVPRTPRPGLDARL